jgi:predicted regulator of Ras-like GTPase activity (Roadblock/LC7/MglB family)
VAVDEAQSPVLLPLQEVLKNLPTSFLKMRDDQEQTDTVEGFETPFSLKAAEDAKRFGPGTAVEKKSEETIPSAPAKAPESKAARTVVPSPASAEAKAPAAELKLPAPVSPSPAPAEKKKDSPPPAEAEKKASAPPPPKLDTNTTAKDVVTRATALSGVTACSITFEDGLSLAGNLPEDVQVGGLCAMAPSVLQKINRHTEETKLGPLRSMTLHCRESRMSFFMKGNVCLTVLHDGGNLTSETQDKLAEMATELSRTYTQPETAHVDH